MSKLTVEQLNKLLGINIWKVKSFRANIAINFDENGNILRVVLLNGEDDD